MFPSFIWMGTEPVCLSEMGGREIQCFLPKFSYIGIMWEVLELQPLAVNKSVNQSSSERCCSREHSQFSFGLSHTASHN